MSTFRMRPVHNVLLIGSEQLRVGLYHLHLATAEQLTRLHYQAGMLKTVKKRLKELEDAHYVQHDAIPTKFFKSPYYYLLGEAGFKYLQGLGFDMNQSWRASEETDKHALFVEHTLELNDVLIAAALIQQSDSRFYLESFIHERALKRHPYRFNWRDVDFATGQSTSERRVALIPDAFISFGNTANDRKFSILLEHDRGTEEQQHFKQKVRAYLAFLHAEAYREMFNISRVTVVFTTFKGDERVKQMREWTRQVLAESNEPVEVWAAFRFASLPKPLMTGAAWVDPLWFYPTDDDEPPHPLLVA